MKLRTLVFWPHLIAGLVAGTVILVMSVTGVLLTYERQLIAWSDSRYRSTVPDGSARPLPFSELLTAARRAAPGVEIASVTLAASASEPVAVAVPGRTFYLDAYTGRLLGDGSQRVRQFMSGLRSWHRWLAVEGDARTTARAITGWSNVLFAFLIATGAYLWIPRTWAWRYVRTVLLFRRGASGKARDFNWHNVIGVWSVVPLFVVVVSAVPISFPWANAAVYVAVGETPPAGRGNGAGAGSRTEGARRNRNPDAPTPDSGRASYRSALPAPAVDDSGLDALLVKAQAQVPGWRTIGVRLPESSTAPVVFNIDRGDGGQPHLRSTLTLARQDGAVVRFEEFSSQTLGRRIRSLMRFAHTGEVLGLAGQTVAGLASAGAVVLVWTGLALAWRRLRAWVSRRSSTATANAASDRTSAVA